MDIFLNYVINYHLITKMLGLLKIMQQKFSDFQKDVSFIWKSEL